jgi:hypothetical protein
MSYKHGDSVRGQKTAEHSIWEGIRKRCTNPNYHAYPRYGGRGIRVCDRWLDPEIGYANFLADMGRRPSPKHSIDRYPDNDGNYEPGNCRWATVDEQNTNKSSTVKITAFGKTLCLFEWARETGIKAATIRYRIKQGWVPELAVSKLPRR